jgi:hypothetical protein
MTKTLAKITLWLLGGGIVLYFGLSFLMSSQLSKSVSDTWKAMDDTSFTCPPGTDVTTRGWSKSGYMRYCEPKKNGPWEAWSEGYRHIQGEYKNGKEHGTWRWFSPNGTIEKTIVYDGGNIISEETSKK